ncbi:MAG TPA: 23S rRNA (uracil(1939)-C(5))-methyltransferase RlmD [Cyclobacteriaceae bacterium]
MNNKEVIFVRMNIKNKHIISNLLIEDIAEGRNGVAKKDGMVYFIPDVVPGDVVDVMVVKKKKNYTNARITRINQPSPERVQPFCDHFGVCGGCIWQDLSYESQLRYKEKMVIDNLNRIAGLDVSVEPIIPSSRTTWFRNKLEYTFSTKRWLTKDEISSGKLFNQNVLGFHVPKHFDKIVNIDECHLQNEPTNAIRNALREFAREKNIAFYDIKNHRGFLRNLIIRTSSMDETMVILQVHYEDPVLIKSIFDYLISLFPRVESWNYIVNKKPNDAYQDQDVVHYQGKGHIREKIGALTFRIGPKSFFQTNTYQTRVLYDSIVELADFKGDEVLYDLYTGTGSIANYVALHVQKVIGLEYVKEAVEDASENSRINNITTTAFYSGDIKDLLKDDFLEEHGYPDTIITDPPRAGMHEDVVKMINKSNAKKVIYVSCNPSTQARDLVLLKECYNIIKAQPIDMFPHTSHVENVTLLVRK